VPGNIPGFTSFYDTGTYVPTYTGSTTSGVTTYTVQVGWYTRIGAIAHVTGTIVWTAATGTGNVRISLPFTSVNNSGQRHAGSVYTESVTFANGSIQAVNFANNNTLRLYSPATNAGSTELVIEAAGQVVFTIWYAVA
jgi:hypothetical protein